MNKANAEIHIDTHVQVCVWKKIQFDFEAMCAVRATSFFPFLFHFFELFWHSVWISYGLLFYSIKCLVCCLNLSIVKWRQDKKKAAIHSTLLYTTKVQGFPKPPNRSIPSNRLSESRGGWREIENLCNSHSTIYNFIMAA